MRIVFFGTPDWAVPTLEALAASSHRPSLVVTQPAKRRGRGGEPSASPVAAASARLGLACIEPDAVRTPEFLERVRAEAPDLFVVVAYGKIFPQRLLDVPRLAPVNVHFSLLPRWRGAAPVQWAVAEGDTETGVATMRMVKELDAGPVYLVQRLRIEPDEHAPRLGARLAEAGASLLLATVEGIAGGSLAPREQEEAGVTFASLLRSEDGSIDWQAPAEGIARRVRGFDPWPGQSATAEKGTLRLIEARAVAGAAGTAPGTVLGASGSALRIACGGGTVLEALVVQPAGRRPISGVEALRGRFLREGERLGGAPPPLS